MRTARILASALAVAAAAFVLAAPGSAENTKLLGSVGPGFTITLTDASGAKVTHLDPGTYDLVVDDQSEFHNFHLIGPGVDVATDVAASGQKTFTITVADGVYTFQCDPHLGDMNGKFAVGSATLPGAGSSSGSSSGAAAGSTKTKARASAPVGARLSLTVGPGFTIALKTAAGKPVTRLAAGAYTFVVDDRATIHNAHLTGVGVNASTGVPFVGKKTLKLTLKKGKLVFVCDPHRSNMKGTVAVS